MNHTKVCHGLRQWRPKQDENFPRVVRAAMAIVIPNRGKQNIDQIQAFSNNKSAKKRFQKLICRVGMDTIRCKETTKSCREVLSESCHGKNSGTGNIYAGLEVFTLQSTEVR